MSDLKLDVDQAGELKAAFRRGDWTNEEIKKLCEGDTLTKVHNLVRGYVDIVTKQHVIDLDVDPYLPNGWKVEEHIKGGQFVYDPAKIEFYLSKRQKKGPIGGHDLRKELQGKPVYNANFLDYWLAHPELIPEELKGKYVFFWGTIYCDSAGGLDARCLYWDGSQWRWGDHWLGSDWHDGSPGALARNLLHFPVRSYSDGVLSNVDQGFFLLLKLFIPKLWRCIRQCRF